MSSRVMQNVDVWPPSGHLDEPWDSNPDVDAFCKSARSVTVVYSIGLRELRLPAFRSWLRFGCGRVSTDGRVRVTVSVDRLEGDLEHASVVLPAGIAEWAPSDRARLALEVVHAGMVRLGESRGWEREELERLRDLTLQRGLEHTLVGDWKASPDRRHSARTCYRIAPDGLGRARLEVADRDGVVVATSPEAIAPAGFRPGISATRDLRWDGVDRVALTTLRRTFRGVEVSVALVREGAAWRGEISDGNDARVPLAGLDAPERRELPVVVAVGTGVDAEDEAPRIRAGGGGPTNDVSRTYLDAVAARLHAFADEGQAWWQDAGLKKLDVTYYFGPEATIWSRRTGQRLRVEIRRPAASTHQSPEELATQDVRAVVAEVRRKTGLGPHRPDHRAR